jgi:hypothetical protein
MAETVIDAVHDANRDKEIFICGYCRIPVKVISKYATYKMVHIFTSSCLSSLKPRGEYITTCFNFQILAVCPQGVSFAFL